MGRRRFPERRVVRRDQDIRNEISMKAGCAEPSCRDRDPGTGNGGSKCTNCGYRTWCQSGCTTVPEHLDAHNDGYRRESDPKARHRSATEARCGPCGWPGRHSISLRVHHFAARTTTREPCIRRSLRFSSVCGPLFARSSFSTERSSDERWGTAAELVRSSQSRAYRATRSGSASSPSRWNTRSSTAENPALSSRRPHSRPKAGKERNRSLLNISIQRLSKPGSPNPRSSGRKRSGSVNSAMPITPPASGSVNPLKSGVEVGEVMHEH